MAWRLRFLPRGRFAVDPLTGWTTGADPLRHVELRFPSREAAMAYAQRQGLPFEMRKGPARKGKAQPLAAATPSPVRLCCWPSGPHAMCCGRYPFEAEEKRHAQTA